MTDTTRELWLGRLDAVSTGPRASAHGPSHGASSRALRRIGVPIMLVTAVVVALAPFIGQRPADQRPLYALVGLALAVCAVVLHVARTTRPWVVDTIAIGAPTLTTLVLVASTTQVGVLPMLLVWPAVAAPYFSSRLGSALTVTVVAVGMTVAVVRTPDPLFSTLGWTVTVFIAVLCSVSVRLVAERSEALMRSLDDRARRDPLTGLLNRRGLDDVLDRAWAGGAGLHVAVLDLDHFKAVNDAHGHAAGDVVLVRFAQVLTAHVRAGDVVARTGGEEFTLVLGPCAPDVALRRVRELVRAFAAVDTVLPDGVLPDGVLRCTASAGLATRGPRHHGVADLLRDADRALYAAKDAGRDRALAAVEVTVPAQAHAPRASALLGGSAQG